MDLNFSFTIKKQVSIEGRFYRVMMGRDPHAIYFSNGNIKEIKKREKVAHGERISIEEYDPPKKVLRRLTKTLKEVVSENIKDNTFLVGIYLD